MDLHVPSHFFFIFSVGVPVAMVEFRLLPQQTLPLGHAPPSSLTSSQTSPASSFPMQTPSHNFTLSTLSCSSSSSSSSSKISEGVIFLVSEGCAVGGSSWQQTWLPWQLNNSVVLSHMKTDARGETHRPGQGF